ncbi:MAG: hypothetical protein ACRDPY_18360 [Streptosporangiaceae bacterium]
MEAFTAGDLTAVTGADRRSVRRALWLLAWGNPDQMELCWTGQRYEFRWNNQGDT